MSATASRVPDGNRDRPLGGHAGGVDVAQQAEVQEADSAVGAQQVVTGVGVSERDPVAIQQPEVEPEDNLAVAVALRLVGPAHGLEALPLDVLGHQHAPRREARVDTGHADERMSSQQPLDAPLVLGL